MNKEEITCKMPKDQISISQERDNECLIWISPRTKNMVNTIDRLNQENKQLKERFNNLKEEYKDRTDTIHDLLGRIDKAIEYIKENNSVFGTNLDMNYLLDILKGEKDD